MPSSTTHPGQCERKSANIFAKNPQKIYEYIDVWSGVCVFFVFSALLEYALVNYASRSVRKKIRKKFLPKNPQKMSQKINNVVFLKHIQVHELHAAKISPTIFKGSTILKNIKKI
jgi:hypothetical protein